ncbi:hypothetical protein HPB47_025886 [Ixodes persulcatus]|uniref:Uncharacterized protein n=1 Tax=Ixodes persulcatus TaxID=34615 RepID=A0AC60Q097_IXOPE|nr:hypothetical protein HPB47_025886 [Ixodes persulcatus]
MCDDVPVAVIAEEGKLEHHVLQTTTERIAPLLELERYGALERILRITAWIMRFVKNCRTRRSRPGDGGRNTSFSTAPHSAHRSPETRTNDLQNGDLVLVHEDKTPRLMWKTGRIETVQLGRDNHVRSCLVRLPSGETLPRPVQLLYPLELASERT